MISTEREAEIVRLYHAEKWTVGTIAKELGVHHDVVERVLAQQTEGPRPARVRPLMVDPYLAFIRSTLEKYPTLTSRRIFEMVRERGYPGRPDHFRHIIARLRPRRPAEAYLRLQTLPGEQAQVDWGHFGKIIIGRASRRLMAFVMVLSFSRMTFLRFFLNAEMPNFLRGHIDAFQFFHGVSRVVLYDNLKSAVLEREGDAIRFHPKLLELKKHYRFDPRPVAKGRGNEKGRVERKIRDIRSSFFAARQFTDIDDLNAQAMQWCTGLAADRPCPEDRTQSVREAFAREQPLLLELPNERFDATERREVIVRKQPYVRFDLNDYSIPHDRTHRTLVVVADLRTVRILDGLETVAEHSRSFDKGAQIENPDHIAELREHKRRAKARSVLDHLRRSAPSAVEFLSLAAERGASLIRLTKQLRELLARYGATPLEQALKEAIQQEAPHIGAVQQVLETQRKQRGDPPPIPADRFDDPRMGEVIVHPHDIATYDRLTENTDDEDTNL